MEVKINKEALEDFVNLEDIPTKNGMGMNMGKQVFDWINSEGKSIKFNYKGIYGELTIIKYIKDVQKTIVEYGKKEYIISTQQLRECQLGNLFDLRTNKFKVKVGAIFKDKNRDITIIDREYRLKPKKVTINPIIIKNGTNISVINVVMKIGL